MSSPHATAAALLGAAVRLKFPHSTYLGSHIDVRGFSVSFAETAPFDASYLSLLEKEMKELSKLEIRSSEMVAANAKELFRAKGEEGIAKSLEGVEGLVEVVHIGKWIDLAMGSLGQLGYFQLLSYVQEKGVVTLTGVSFASQKELKTFHKKWQSRGKTSGAAFGEKLGLFSPPFWHERGLVLQQVLQDKWLRLLHSAKFCRMEGGGPKEYFARSGHSQIGTWNQRKDQLFSFEQEGLISCLQLIQKWINIYDFESKWVLHAGASRDLRAALKNSSIPCEVDEQPKKGLTVYLLDGLGLPVEGPYIEGRKGQVSCTLLGDLQTFVELVLEQVKGELPYWLAPEQVRVLPMDRVDASGLIKNLEALGVRFFVDQSSSPLKEKMHRALQLNVPCVIVFGKQEEKTGKLSLRVRNAKQNQTMTLDQLNIFLSEQALESQ